MTKREAMRWACGLSAALLTSDIAMDGAIPDDESDRDAKMLAMREVIRELERRGDHSAYAQRNKHRPVKGKH